MKMHMPETLDRLNAALITRYQMGLSFVVDDVGFELLCDDLIGPFLRLTVHLNDGDSFVVDSLELPPPLRDALGQAAQSETLH